MNMHKIIWFNMENNQLVHLPETIGQLANLYKLSLANNPLQRLPDGIGYMRSLAYLDRSGTQLKMFPDTMFMDNPNLKEIKVEPSCFNHHTNLTMFLNGCTGYRQN